MKNQIRVKKTIKSLQGMATSYRGKSKVKWDVLPISDIIKAISVSGNIRGNGANRKKK